MSRGGVFRLWGPPVALAVVGTVLAALKTPSGSAVFWDKAVHAGGYFALCLLLLRATHGRLAPPRPAASAIAAIVATAHGVAVEVMQAYLPWREGSFGDAVADAAGALGAIAVMGVWAALRSRGRLLAEEDR